MGEKLTTQAKGRIPKTTSLFLAVFVVILLLVVGCQEKQPDDAQAVATETVAVATAVPTEAPTEEESEAVPLR